VSFICMYIRDNVYFCEFVYSCGDTHSHTYTCIFIHTHIHIYSFTLIYIYIHSYAGVHRCLLHHGRGKPERQARTPHVLLRGMCVCVYVCVYVNECMCVYTNKTHTHNLNHSHNTHTHTHTGRKACCCHPLHPHQLRRARHSEG
jgi:hypothetical protein